MIRFSNTTISEEKLSWYVSNTFTNKKLPWTISANLQETSKNEISFINTGFQNTDRLGILRGTISKDDVIFFKKVKLQLQSTKDGFPPVDITGKK